MEDYFYLGPVEEGEEVYEVDTEPEPQQSEEKSRYDILTEKLEQGTLTSEERKELQGLVLDEWGLKKSEKQKEPVEQQVPQLGSLDATPVAQPIPQEDNSIGRDKSLTKEMKIENTAQVIASMSDAITIPNTFGELSTYRAKKQYKDGPVVYWEEAYRTELEHMVYRRLLDPAVCAKAKCKLPATANNARIVTDTLLHATYSEMGIGRRKTIMLTSKYIKDNGAEAEATYYDMQKGEILEYSDLDESLKGKCFSRFCNTTSEVLHVPVIPEEKIDLEIVQEYANQAYADLEKWYEAYDKGNVTDDKYQIRFEDTFLKWACGDRGLYKDIITMCATPLMVRKPECTFFILGEKSNGKSSLRHLMQCTYGVRNCASVQVAQMGSWDYASTLLGKVINFPDEEKTNLEDMDVASFKSMSTHENLQIRKKGSSVPFDIPCDFVSIIPLNTYPDWKALDGGVARRVRILPFNADLSAESAKGGIGFEEQKFTGEFISSVIGELIGTASFYARTGRDIVWSDTTNEASSDWQKELVNAPLFKKDFEKVFRGFQSTNLLYECYQKWCKGGLGAVDTGIDYQWETKKRIKEVFTQFGGYDKNTVMRTLQGGIHITKGNQPCPTEWALWEGATIDVGHIGGLEWGTERGVMTVREILDMGADPITLRLMEQGLDREDGAEALPTQPTLGGINAE